MYKTRNLPRSARRDACQSKNTRIDVADAFERISGLSDTDWIKRERNP